MPKAPHARRACENGAGTASHGSCGSRTSSRLRPSRYRPKGTRSGGTVAQAAGLSRDRETMLCFLRTHKHSHQHRANAPTNDLSGGSSRAYVQRLQLATRPEGKREAPGPRHLLSPVAVAQTPEALAGAALRVGSKNPKVIARPLHALLCFGATGAFHGHYSERRPGCRRRLCATATPKSKSEPRVVGGRPTQEHAYAPRRRLLLGSKGELRLVRTG
jgi:hypothetical protein